MGLHTFKVMLSYLPDYDLVNSVSYFPDVTSRVAEELLRKRQIIVRRIETTKSTGRFVWVDKVTGLTLQTCMNPFEMENAVELCAKSTFQVLSDFHEECVLHAMHMPEVEGENESRSLSPIGVEPGQGKLDLSGITHRMKRKFGCTQVMDGSMDSRVRKSHCSTTSPEESSN